MLISSTNGCEIIIYGSNFFKMMQVLTIYNKLLTDINNVL